MLAITGVFIGDAAVHKQGVPLRIVPPDLAGELVEHAVVADPIRQSVAEPGAALWTVVVGPGRPHFLGEPRLPMDSFWAIGNAVRIRNPQTGMPGHHLVGQLVSADIEATPALGIGDEAGDGHRPFHQCR